MTTPEKLYVVGGDGWVLDDGGNGRLIANCGGYTESLDPAKSNDENRANAKRIALRYNTHPDLVAALELLLRTASGLYGIVQGEYGGPDPDISADIEIARAALAAAKGEAVSA